MILDSSAIMAILRHEPENERFAELLEIAPTCRMSAGTYVECSVVIARFGDVLKLQDFDELLSTSATTIEAVTPAQAEIGRRAYLEYGKGSGHPARLNFGDCFAYALAIDTDEPLLFKGDDFSHTDVTIALPNGR